MEAVFERASANARSAIRRAEAFRSRTGQTRIHMEHLLTGLFDTEESVAATRLRDAGLDRDRLRKVLGSIPKLRVPEAEPYRAAGIDGIPLVSKHVDQALARALELAGPSGMLVSEFLLEGWLSVESCSVVKGLPAGIRARLTDRSAQVGAAGEDDPTAAGRSRTLTLVPDGTKGVKEDAELLFERSKLEPHVLTALACAEEIADGQPIDARAALLGVLSASLQDKPSEAFEHLARLLPIAVDSEEISSSTVKEAPAQEQGEADDSTGDIHEFDLASAFASSVNLAGRHIPRDEPLWGRDWIAAALLTTGDPSLEALARQEGRIVAHLQDQWFLFVTASTRHRSADAWEAWWRDAGVPLPSERSIRPGFHPEAIRAEDHIGVKPEVMAFARLIADEATTPPLSIGLLGDWGSGKSFFMELLHDQVEKLTTVQGDDGPTSPFAQIRFNAWHYSDSNLWASLVGHIFDEIWRKVVPTDTAAESRRQLEREIEKAHGALFEAEAQVAEARDVVQEAEAQIDRQLQKLAIHDFVAEQTREELGELANAMGWIEPKAVVQLEDALDRLADSKRQVREILELSLRNYPVPRTVAWIIGSVLAAAAIAVPATAFVDHELIRGAVARAATVGGVVASLVSAVAVPLSRASKLVTKFTKTLRDAHEQYTTKLDSMRDDPRYTSKADDIDTAREELKRAEVRAAAARVRVAGLRTQRTRLDPGRRLAAFLEGRAESDDYRARQGILSLVRRDFERLSDLMADWRTEKTPPPPGIRPLDRIVLYVDDLDRCRPSVVVQALEAVHLLLALNLFVVVVAVDSRWLLRSLEVHYKELLRAREEEDDRDGYRLSTPQNYLEKIFQVTFALAPMGSQGFGRYVDFLAQPLVDAESQEPEAPAEETTEPEAPRDAASASQPDLGAQSPPDEGFEPAAEAAAAPHAVPTDDEGTDSTGGETEQAEAVTPVIDPTRPLVISDAEREFLKTLHPLVPTPRLAKRLVNVFRLIKAGVPTTELDAFEDPRHGRYRTVLLLLAILYGRSTIAIDLFRRLCDDPADEWSDGMSLHEALRTLAAEKPDNRQSAKARQETVVQDRAAPSSELPKLVQALAPEVTVGRCRDEVRDSKLARYSLVTGQHWHTWRTPEEVPEGPNAIPSPP